MKIGIVLHPYGEDKPAGLGRYIFELTRAMLDADSQNHYIIFLKNKPKIMPQFSGSNWQPEVIGGGLLWLDKIKNKPPADIYIFNTPATPLFWRPKKSIVIAFDFFYKHLPVNSFKELVWLKVLEKYHAYSLRNADAIVATSEATRRDIVNFFRIPENKIRVIYTGFNKICDIKPKKVSAPKPYFLFAGAVKKRKNVFNLVKGFDLFNHKHSGYHLVIAGNASGSYGDEIRKYIGEQRLTSQIILLGYVSDDELSFLYKEAFDLYFPAFKPAHNRHARQNYRFHRTSSYCRGFHFPAHHIPDFLFYCL